MRADDIQTAAVIGAGTMGHGIAQVLAMAGIRTRLHDVDAGAVERGLESVRKNLAQGVERSKVTKKEQSEALRHLAGAADLAEALEGVQLVVEAVPERIDLKQALFEDLGARVAPDTLLATNTSSLPIARLAAVCERPERVVGLHFFNPVHIMKLLEVVQAERTSEETVECALDLARRLGKEPIRVKDSPGFASSRLGLALGLEAIRMVEAGVASAADIDKAMTLGYGHPMGPLRLTDLVGLDVRLAIAEYLEREVGPAFAPPPLLREKVQRGELGKKSGQGFYEWT